MSKSQLRLWLILALPMSLGCFGVIVIGSFIKDIQVAHEKFLVREGFSRIIADELRAHRTQGQIDVDIVRVDGPGADELIVALRRLRYSKCEFVTYALGDKTVFFVFVPDTLELVSRGYVAR